MWAQYSPQHIGLGFQSNLFVHWFDHCIWNTIIYWKTFYIIIFYRKILGVSGALFSSSSFWHVWYDPKVLRRSVQRSSNRKQTKNLPRKGIHQRMSNSKMSTRSSTQANVIRSTLPWTKRFALWNVHDYFEAHKPIGNCLWILVKFNNRWKLCEIGW